MYVFALERKLFVRIYCTIYFLNLKCFNFLISIKHSYSLCLCVGVCVRVNECVYVLQNQQNASFSFLGSKIFCIVRKICLNY